MTTRKTLTDTYISKHKPARAGTRAETIDLEHRRLRLRVTESGHKSFVYVARFPGCSNPTRRSLGDYPTTSLAQAREKARKWDVLIANGIDPKVEERRLLVEAEAARRRSVDNRFEARVEEFLVRHCAKHRTVANTRRLVYLAMPTLRDRSLDSITSRDIKHLVGTIAERSPSTARNLLAALKSFFGWAAEMEHVDDDPAAGIRAARLVGPKVVRQRLLTDDEVRAIWQATEALEYPIRHFYQLLILTGVRLREAASARWREFDLEARIWSIPPERYKTDTHHFVPLTDPVMMLLLELPRFDNHDYLFSTTFGAKPSSNFSKNKAKLDRLLGEEADPWVVHDLRRFVRTKLAMLGVPDVVAELVIGHGRKGIGKVYDQHQYHDEIRRALDLWASHLRDLVTPPDPNKIVKLPGAAA